MFDRYVGSFSNFQRKSKYSMKQIEDLHAKIELTNERKILLVKFRDTMFNFVV